MKGWRSITGRAIPLGFMMVTLGTTVAAQSGSIRGVVYDEDFEAPLPAVRVQIAGATDVVQSSDQGDYVIRELAPGTYTLVFSKEGYVRQVRPNVVVTAGQLTDLDVWMSGDFTDMEEFVVQDTMNMGGDTEAGLLSIRFESPALLDSISADLMQRAGVGDAASALKLVSGASVEGGKFAVIRGLPDRYVSSQLNGVRLPSADQDKRAVELDQFPSAVIESIRVSKTFTPDQQGDASGGAVDVRLKGVPEESVFKLSLQTSYNDNVARRGDFLSYDGGGVGNFGLSGSEKDPQTEGESWKGAVGVSETDAPIDYKLSLAAGGKQYLDNGVKVGGFASLFYERDSSFHDDGINDSYWVDTPGGGLVPEKKQDQGEEDFKTALFDVTESSQLVQWGGMGIVGAEWDDHLLALTLLYSHTAEDKVTLAEDTRGKEYFFPGHDPDDPDSPGADDDFIDAAPYLRTQTLDYTERTTGTLQLSGRHGLSSGDFDLGPLSFREPEVDWTLAASFADLDQPDKRQFGSKWFPGDFQLYAPHKPDANFTLGNLQRIWKKIEEDSNQYNVNVKWPMEAWSGEGFFKVGLFGDRVDREYDQETYSNFTDFSTYGGSWDDDLWSDVFPFEDHPITGSEVDVDYDGEQNIDAFYAMVDVPITDRISVVTGARFESTEISITNFPEAEAKYYPEGAIQPVDLLPGVADADFSQDDVLPSLGVVFDATEELTLRASWSRTVARQTFKELTPIIQQEFLGGPIFVGNPDLQMSALENFDLRADYKPEEGSLLSVSLFHKDVTDPIEYVTEEVLFTFTTAKNYPKGTLTGIELEARQELERFWEDAEGLSIGCNATFLDSEVQLPKGESDQFMALFGIPLSERDMTLAPEYIYNVYLTYDFEDSGTELSAFYTFKGDTLVAGAGESNDNFVPSVYAKGFGTLNLGLSQRLGDRWSLKLQAKNLTNPEIEEVYRSDYVSGGDVTKTSYTKGREFSIGLSFTP